MRQPIKRLILLLATLLLIVPAASAEDPRVRPGVVRLGDVCFQTTNISSDFPWDRKIPCDGRYKDGEEIAGRELLLKEDLNNDNSPRSRADWEAWQASAAAGATTSKARFEAFDAEARKQAEQHADVSKPFLHGTCQPNNENEKNNKEIQERGCKYDETDFQRNYWFALQGDHQAQENVAFCFQDDVPSATSLGFRWPCHRVVGPDKTMMCAWYLVAASSGHPKSAESAEMYGYVNECDKPMYVRQAIFGTATELFLRIYHRPIPVAR
jgi:hypothetical protein